MAGGLDGADGRRQGKGRGRDGGIGLEGESDLLSVTFASFCFSLPLRGVDSLLGSSLVL